MNEHIQQEKLRAFKALFLLPANFRESSPCTGIRHAASSPKGRMVASPQLPSTSHLRNRLHDVDETADVRLSYPIHFIAMSYTIGFALHSKKAQRYLTKRVVDLAEDRGLHIIEVDKSKPLEGQGPFHLILHKCHADKKWETELAKYSAAHPEVQIVDAIDRVLLLRNRQTMFSLLPKMNGCGVWSMGNIRVSIPQQVEIRPDASVGEIERHLAEKEVTYPLLLKPEWADGRDGSHMLGFIRDREGLTKALNPQFNAMQPPLIAQQIIPHDPVIYKVYVIGDGVICHVRPSLVISKCVESFQLLPRISSKAKCQRETKLPPEDFTTSLAHFLKEQLRIQLFNFDLIRVSGQEHVYYIVDINYFPGIDKLENFEEIFVQFLFRTCQETKT